MVRILIVSSHYKKKSPGGASQSIINIFEVLKEISHFNIKFLHPSLGKFKNFLLPPDISSYFFIPKILREIKKFKPHIIITQRDIGKAAIISGRIKKIPVINIIRDTSLICPKYLDIVDYGNSCPGLKSKDICYSCINYWRTLRVLLGNRPKGWQNSLKSTYSTLGYKILYFICRMQLYVFNKASINLVASNLMKSILSNNLRSEKIKVLNITPIEKKEIPSSINKKNQLLYLIPSYDASHKGLNFVFNLSKYIPNNYRIIIVGKILAPNKIREFQSKIINYGFTTGKQLDYLFQSSKITIVPTFCTEAFGRIIIESIINKTPVISSPNCGANSFFDINTPTIPKLIGELLEFEGYLRYDNGTVINSTYINYFWYESTNIISSGSVFTDSNGEIPNIQIPDNRSNNLDLKLTFESPPEIGYSEILLSDTKIFTNISCIWDLPTTIRALSNLTISGQVVSKTDPNLIIKERPIEIYYNGTFLAAVQTDSNGEFSYAHLLSAWNGSSLITLRLVNNLGKNVITTYYIIIETSPQPITPTTDVPPFLMFFLIFIPILACVIGGLAFYGYRYYKKQDKLSKVVNLPLEGKIINLKILKDTGRLEESLSYLFNAIYMDLINAKFGRTRSDNETIRDFAIISVKNLKLSPTTIYPFIQKVEEIIYAKPFQITDKEFYNTINLFSPIYFELTGYNFVLNF